MLRLTPKSAGAVVLVSVSAVGLASDLGEWWLPRASLAELSAVTARDAVGALQVSVHAEGAGVRLRLARAPVPPLTLSFERATTPGVVELDPNRLVAAGAALFAVPLAWRLRPVPTRLEIVAKKLYAEGRGASALGVGDLRELEVSGDALGRTTVLAGQLGHAVLDGPEGHDEMAWLGYTSFDPRSVAAEVAAFRSAVRDYFGEKRSAPCTLLLTTDARPAGSFDVTRQTASVLATVGVSQTYNGPLRVAVAHQLLREWIGPVLHVGDAARPAESLWFVEGLSRFLARELTFRFGLLAPVEYLAEVDEIERLVLTSPDAARGNAELASRATEPAVAALLVARGARHATSVDAAIRRKSGGKRSLDGVLRALYAEALRAQGPLPESAWGAALERELGAEGALLHREEVATGRPRPLPNDALGPCFIAGPRRFESLALGFEASGEPPVVARVTPGSPAERAGLRVGDGVGSLPHASTPAVPVRLEIERAGQKQRIEFRPVGALVPGRGFTRVARVPDERCARR